MRTYNLFEVLEYGPVVAWDESSGMLITVNKVVFSSWIVFQGNSFIGGNTCLIKDIEKVGNCTDFDLVCEVANEWLQELLDTDGEGEPSNS